MNSSDWRSSFSPAVGWIIMITVGVYVLQVIPGIGRPLEALLALVPSKVLQGEVWRVGSYALLHDTFSPFHILFNMLSLWMFGVELERLWGTRKFSIFYASCAVMSGVFSLLMLLLGDPWIIGASGALLAVLTAYAILFPDRQILLFMIFPVPVRIAVVIFGMISIVGTMGSTGNIAHLTHLGGILAAFVFLKMEPLVLRQKSRISAGAARAEMLKRSAEKYNRDRYWDEIVDPLLKKVSEKGEGSLTAEERKLLAEVGSRKKGGGGMVVKGRFGRP